MTASDLTLNIAVNMGRLARFALEGRTYRIDQFLDETQRYLDELENSQLQNKFKPTFEFFKEKFERLKQNKIRDADWAEEALTWANILTHRAKLA
jgi:hypothetical protein